MTDKESFRRMAAAAMHQYLRKSENNRASGEDMTDHCKEMGITAHDDRAFGWVFSELCRKGVIRCVGYTRRRKGHGTAGARIWQLAI
jgi:hypothetical protein